MPNKVIAQVPGSVSQVTTLSRCMFMLDIVLVTNHVEPAAAFIYGDCMQVANFITNLDTHDGVAVAQLVEQCPTTVGHPQP